MPTGNFHHLFCVGFITLYDGKNKTVAQRQEIADATKRFVDKSAEMKGLAVEVSGTLSQPDDLRTFTKAPISSGTRDAVATVAALKRKADPTNRFRFHPCKNLL